MLGRGEARRERSAGRGAERNLKKPTRVGRHLQATTDVTDKCLFEGQHAPQRPQDQDADGLSDPNPAGALSLKPTSSPAQVHLLGKKAAPVK